eukprot:Gb_03835 [translate_table: standard]
MSGNEKYSDQESIVQEVLEENARPINEALQGIILTLCWIADLVQQMDENQQKNRNRKGDVRPQEPGCSSEHGSYEKGELGTFVPLPSDATKQANLFVPRSNEVLPMPASSLVSTGHVLEPALAKYTTNALDKFSRVAYEQAFAIQFDNLSPLLMNAIAVKITHPETHEDLKLDSNGESVLTVDTMTFDPRGINFDSPFVLTVGTMVIDTRVCDLRVPTLGTMVVSIIAMDSSIPNVGTYGYLKEEGQRIKEILIGPEFQDPECFSWKVDDQGCVKFGGFLKVIGYYGSRGHSVVFSNIQTIGKIKVIIGIPEQYQIAFMLEDVGIFDDRENSDANINVKASNATESSKVKAQKLFSELKRVAEKCPVGDMGCLNGVPTDEPLDIKTTLLLDFLKHHMLGTLVASLRKIHLESGLADAIVGGGIENKLVQPQFSISLKSVVEHDEKQVEDLTMSTLKMLVDEGVEILQHVDAILLIEGYSDFLTKELLLQVINIGHNAIRAICQKVELFVTKSGRNKVDETTRVPPPECYEQVEELAKSGLIEDLQSKKDRIIKSDEVVETNEVEQDESMAANGEVDEGWK